MDDALRNHFLFRHLKDADLKKLGALARHQEFADGQPIFAKGDPASGMSAVLRGRVRIVSYSIDGKEVVLRVVEPGEVFGEIALIDGSERTADAVASGDTRLLCLDRRDFLPFLEANPGLSVELLKVLCKRLRATSEQLEDFSFLDLRARLAKCLLHLADRYGETDGAGTRITLPLSQQFLAAMMGTSREAVNKRLREWEREGVLALGRESVTLLDRDSLEQIDIA